jgi:hypothetical protein
VLRASPVYDLPDGNGTSYKKPNGDEVILAVGRKVPVLSPLPCPNHWCKAVVPEVTGDAYVYTAEGYMEEPAP